MPKTLTLALATVLAVAVSTHAVAFVGSPFPGVPGPFPSPDAFEAPETAETVTRDGVAPEKAAPLLPERRDR